MAGLRCAPTPSFGSAEEEIIRRLHGLRRLREGIEGFVDPLRPVIDKVYDGV